MTGAFVNAMGILLGSLFGLSRRQPISQRYQLQIRLLLGLLTILAGARLMWQGVNGKPLTCLKELLLAVVAITIGPWLGRLLVLQTVSNWLGRHASGLIKAAQKQPQDEGGQGVLAATILFCAAPLGLIGAVTEGLSGNFDLLVVKALMDALAATSFVKLFRWPVAMSAVPVYLFFGGLTLAAHHAALTYLTAPGLIDAIDTTAGLLAWVVSVVIFETRKVELANYLPALFVAPLLAKWFGWQ
jgi:uncharacterized membrane protein YqgA involved in biofilm formation